MDRTLGRILCVLLLASLGTPPPACAGAAPLRVRWLGVAGFSVEAGETVLAHDPYLSRPGLWETLVYRYEPNRKVLRRMVARTSPAPELARARLVLIGHSHFDHVADAPWLAQRTGATLAGSLTTVCIGRGYGLDEAQTRRVDPGDVFEAGPFTVRVVESRHAAVLFGRVPLQGALSEPPDGPIRAVSMPLGDARGYLLIHRPTGLRIYHLSSAGLHEPALAALRDEGVRVDLLLASIVGRDERFTRTLVEMLRPRIVVPHHTDDFFTGLLEPDAGAPRDPDDVDAFEAEVAAAAAELGHAVEVRRLALWERLELGPAR